MRTNRAWNLVASPRFAWAWRVISLLALALIVAGCGNRGSKTPIASSLVSPPAVEPLSDDEFWQMMNRGVGYMEQFDKFEDCFAKAAEVYEEVVRRRPDSTAAKFNLAVSVINAKPPVYSLSRAKELLEDILRHDDGDARAHYTLGFIFQFENEPALARSHFEKVSELVPSDASNWLRLGDCLWDLEEQLSASPGAGARPGQLTARACFERALELNPNNATCYYKLKGIYQQAGESDRAVDYLNKFTALRSTLHDLHANDYIWSGPLAEVIGLKLPPPRPDERQLPMYEPAADASFLLADDARWATDADLAATSHGALLARIRARFGAGVAAFDYDKDGAVDLFLPASAVVNGRLRDTLLRNDGHGRFEDVTATAGLATSRETIGCAVADFDCDGFADLFITAVGGNVLLRNNGRGAFEDVTEAVGVADNELVSLSAQFLDLDHDGDLDLVVAHYGPLADAEQMFRERPYAGGAASSLFMNVGKARLESSSPDELPPLEVAFQRVNEPAEAWQHRAATVGFVAADFDGDRDLDLVEINDGTACRMLINRRFMRFDAVELPADAVPLGLYNGGLVADFNCDLRMDLLLASPTRPCVMLLNDLTTSKIDQVPPLRPVTTDLRSVRAAQLWDADFDGWPDIVGLSAERATPLLGLNRPRGLMARPEWLAGLLGADVRADAGLVADFFGQSWPQILVVRSGHGPALFKTGGNGNKWLALNTTGRREKKEFDKKTMRSNPDGLGTRVIVHSGPHTTAWENTTTAIGPCTSRLPIPAGLGTRRQADAVRLRWPDGVEQAELNLPAGQICTIVETQRRDSSCPLLFAWNGRRFEFITDFLGGGGLGYLVAPDVFSDPDPDEDVKIETQQLVADERGQFILKIAEPMDELTYLDAAWLEVIDHPAELTVYPDERFDPASPHPAGGRFCFRDHIVPAARDHRGRDVTKALAAWDRNTVDGFRRSAMWIGYAEDHWVDLDFGDAFADVNRDEPIALFLAGWVEYPYSQTNWAASTAGVRLDPPVLEWLDSAGDWQPLVANMGYPAGLPRMMTLDLTGKLPAEVRRASGQVPLRCRLRIRTNMEIYWDQIFAARLESTDQLRRTRLDPTKARLSYRGYLQEFSPDGREPRLFDYHQIISVPLVGPVGPREPRGDVRDLVLRQDDRFALINAGDELTLSFDAGRLPPLPPGWTRSFVLRSFGYCKDTDLFNPIGDTVDPLPKRTRANANE